jgi:ribose transport system substrate-binding protein
MRRNNKWMLFGALFYSANLAAASAQDLIAYISPIGAQPGQQEISAAIQHGANEKGWSYRVLDANLSADRQVSHVDTLLTMGAKAIGSWSLDANAVGGAYNRAKAQAVPVIGVNSYGEGVTNTVWWEYDACRPNGPYTVQTAWIAKHKPAARVIVVGGPPVESIVKRAKCFTDAAKAAGLKIVDRIDNTKDSAANASTLMSAELLRFPDVNVIWAYNDASALGSSAAVIANGGSIYDGKNENGIMVFGNNGDSDAITAVKEGRLTGTWDPDNFATGIAVVDAMAKALEKPGEQQSEIIVAAKFFTFENIDTWVEGAKRGYSLSNYPVAK